MLLSTWKEVSISKFGEHKMTDRVPPGREALMNALVDHVQSHGMPPTSSTRQIAATIGTSHTRLRYEFGSRAQLLAEVLREARLRDHRIYYSTASEFGFADGILAAWSFATDQRHRPRAKAFWTLMAAAANDPQDYPDTIDTVHQPLAFFTELAKSEGLSDEEAARTVRTTHALILGLLLEVSLGVPVEEASATLRDFLATNAPAQTRSSGKPRRSRR